MPPTALLESLRAIGRKVKLYGVAIGAWRIVAAAVGLLVGIVLIDYLAHETGAAPGGLPGGLRLALELIAFAVLALWAVRWVVRPAVKTHTVNDVAGWVEERYPQFGDTLRSTVNFLSTDVPGSAVMKDRVVQQATEAASKADLNAVIDRRPLVHATGVAVGAVFGLLILILLVGPEFRRVAGSWLVHPLSGQVWPKTVQIALEGNLPPRMAVGDVVPLSAILAEQHFTEPPPRFSEASLVKALEEFGIGRPSTYASIIQTLLSREYVTLDARRFRPTDVGRAVSKFLSGHFTRYVDYDFTAKLEDELDAVSRGEEDWVPLMQRFWSPFKSLVEEKNESVDRSEASGSRVLGDDPVSGKPVTVRLGRFGPFAQIGTKEDEDKPRFASLRANQSIHTISLPDALELFKLPRNLGAHPDGTDITVGVGRFGPFVKHGSVYASLKAEDDPYTVELARAVQLLHEKAEAAANRLIKSFQDGAIQVLRGRYGPYITDGAKNGRIPKDREPESLTEAECLEFLAAAPDKPARGGGRFGKGKGKSEPKAAAKKSADAKPAAKKAAATKTTAKKTTAKKATAKKAASKSTAKKAAAKKAPARSKA